MIKLKIDIYVDILFSVLDEISTLPRGEQNITLPMGCGVNSEKVGASVNNLY